MGPTWFSLSCTSLSGMTLPPILLFTLDVRRTYTGTIAPVTCAAASLTRKAMMPATLSTGTQP